LPRCRPSVAGGRLHWAPSNDVAALPPAVAVPGGRRPYHMLRGQGSSFFHRTRAADGRDVVLRAAVPRHGNRPRCHAAAAVGPRVPHDMDDDSVIVAMDAAAMTFPDGSFACAFSHSCFEHLAAPGDVIEQAALFPGTGRVSRSGCVPSAIPRSAAHLLPCERRASSRSTRTKNCCPSTCSPSGSSPAWRPMPKRSPHHSRSRGERR
jgi:hypothetical protein